MMTFFKKQPVHLTSTLALCSILSVSLSMCKQAEDETSSNTDQKQNAIDPIKAKELEAIEVIKKDPDIELVKVIDDKITIQNVHSKLGMILPFQEIIDGNYDSIKGGVEILEKVAPPLPSNTFEDARGHNATDWGKTPEWIPRYPKLRISEGAIHAPKQDGSIWGQLNATHDGSYESIRDFYLSELPASGIPFNAETPNEFGTFLIFKTHGLGSTEKTQKRLVSVRLRRSEPVTEVIIQYQYGMK